MPAIIDWHRCVIYPTDASFISKMTIISFRFHIEIQLSRKGHGECSPFLLIHRQTRQIKAFGDIKRAHQTMLTLKKNEQMKRHGNRNTAKSNCKIGQDGQLTCFTRSQHSPICFYNITTYNWLIRTWIAQWYISRLSPGSISCADMLQGSGRRSTANCFFLGNPTSTH